MQYPIFIEPGSERHAFGVVVPDLPGCFSAGDTLEEAILNTREAAALWLESQLDSGEAIPSASPLAIHRKHYRRWIPSLVEIDLKEILGDVKRVNISLPARVLRRLDAQARKARIDRSAYIAKLALERS